MIQILQSGDRMLFGTDGIRGEVVDSPNNDEDAISYLVDERKISPRLMKLVGEALSRNAPVGSQVIIGWDDRPNNCLLYTSPSPRHGLLSRMPSSA